MSDERITTQFGDSRPQLKTIGRPSRRSGSDKNSSAPRAWQAAYPKQRAAVD
jgi:hypothetical protein